MRGAAGEVVEQGALDGRAGDGPVGLEQGGVGVAGGEGAAGIRPVLGGGARGAVEDTVGGFDAFIAEQRETPGECRVTLAQFDDAYEEVYADRPIADVPSLVLQPRGTTALLDSVARIVLDAGKLEFTG